MRHSVILISNHHFGWGAVQTTLHGNPSVTLLGDVATATEALALLSSCCSDTILLPERLQGESTLPLIVELRRRCPGARILVLAEALYRDELPELVRLGVNGYLLWQDLTAETLPRCLDTFFETGIGVASLAAFAALFKAPDREEADPSAPALSARQRTVLQALACGLTQDEIARRLQLSPRTVKRAVSELRLKLDAPTASTLVLKATQYRLMS